MNEWMEGTLCIWLRARTGIRSPRKLGARQGAAWEVGLEEAAKAEGEQVPG